MVATYINWVFLRQPSHMGEFQLYTDRESLIAHFNRVLKLLIPFTIAEIGIGLINIMFFVIHFISGHPLRGILNLVVGILTVLIGIGLIKIATPIIFKVRDLKREQNLME